MAQWLSMLKLFFVGKKYEFLRVIDDHGWPACEWLEAGDDRFSETAAADGVHLGFH